MLVAPGQGEPGFDRIIIVAQPFGKQWQEHEGTIRRPCLPGIKLLELRLAHELRQILGECDGVGELGMLCRELRQQVLLL